MAKSKYAVRNGVCVAKACKGVRIGSTGPYAPSQRVQADREGERPPDRHRRSSTGAARRTGHASNNPVIVNVQWVAPCARPLRASSTCFFAGRNIRPTDNLNYSLLGLTAAQAARLKVSGAVGRVPSVDADIARCSTLDGTRRRSCYAALDRQLTTMVPVIPFLWRNADHDPRTAGREVGVRPVRRHDRVRARRGQALT